MELSEKLKVINQEITIETLKELSKENLIQIQDWSWEKKALQLKKFFDENI
ncbi:MAG: hypothetical protein ACI4VQ_05260 [Clostridia bacterium]